MNKLINKYVLAVALLTISSPSFSRGGGEGGELIGEVSEVRMVKSINLNHPKRPSFISKETKGQKKITIAPIKRLETKRLH